jgi:putative PIN family toxin of toxin-antitoxin system
VRLVLDTNILIAAVAADGLCRDLVRRRLESHSLITSRTLLNELREKLEEKFDVIAKDIPFLRAYEARADFFEPAPLDANVCRDPDDVAVLATAIAGKADFVITGDKDLLVFGQYEGIRILTPRQWLESQDQLSSG